MANKNSTNYQLKVLTKVLEAGYISEKDITTMSIDKILAIPNITVADISIINELQKAIKSNKVITFLGGSKENAES